MPRGAIPWPSIRLGLLAVGLYMAGGFGNGGAATGSVAYGYDALGRIVTISFGIGLCTIYRYDANNNRLTQTVATGTGGPLTWGTGTWGCYQW